MSPTFLFFSFFSFTFYSQYSAGIESRPTVNLILQVRDPAEVYFHKLRAYCHLKIGNLDLAELDLMIWVEQNPYNEKDRIQLSDVLLSLVSNAVVSIYE